MQLEEERRGQTAFVLPEKNRRGGEDRLTQEEGEAEGSLLLMDREEGRASLLLLAFGDGKGS